MYIIFLTITFACSVPGEYTNVPNPDSVKDWWVHSDDTVLDTNKTVPKSNDTNNNMVILKNGDKRFSYTDPDGEIHYETLTKEGLILMH
jgi:hypothetical protein